MNDDRNQAPILQAEALSKSYRMGTSRLQVLRDVQLRLFRGEICALMGASGSGKSTLLHLLGLLDRPDQGEIFLDGRAMNRFGQTTRAKCRARNIGFVFQQFHLLPELSALENVLMPRRLARGLAWFATRHRERDRAREILRAVGLEARMRHRPHQLSGGEQQRVAIARALVSRPAVLLADEPTGNLDSSTGAEILDLLLRLAKEHQTGVVLATHDSNVAAHSDRHWRLVDGAMLQEPSLETAAETPTPEVEGPFSAEVET
ncbi:MAG: ABC transporter ATP-binding protein [Planctomycetota bacterium]|nr:MAG: ABC transporter ATP-binding protein [Planctomycetota bacterium]